MKPIIFFDGVCGLCNTFVDFLILRDKKETFLFAPLQGSTAKQMLPAVPDMESVILFDETGIHEKSTAAIKILVRLGGLWKWTGVFFALPKILRDPVYDFIAAHRYRMFGKKESCRLPTAEERRRFLD